MPWRVRRTIRLAKGVRINLSKRGASLSLGGRGLTTNMSKRGVRTTIGIPGTGISYTTEPSSKKKAGVKVPSGPATAGCLLPIAALSVVLISLRCLSR